MLLLIHTPYSEGDRAHLMWREPALRGIGLYLIDKKTNNVCLLFKFIVNIQTAQNVMTYRHSPRNSPSLLSTRVLIHAVGGTHIGQSEASDQRRPPRLHYIP